MRKKKAMNKERAIEVIENLRDYAHDNWDYESNEEELDEIWRAVDFIKSQLSKSKCAGTAEINGKKYLISEL